MGKPQQIGLCKMCLRQRLLCKSHLMPASLYKACRAPSLKNPDPIFFTKGLRFTTSRQEQAYLLCLECEERINANSEKKVLPWLYRGADFALLSRLNLALPHLELQPFTFYNAASIGINANDFCYFALSVMWKGAVHAWSRPSGAPAPYIDLGGYAEITRQFLLGNIILPREVMVSVIVCTDRLSRMSLSVPGRVPTYPWPTFSLIAGGVHFIVSITGQNLSPPLEMFLGGTSRDGRFLLRDCAGKTFDAIVSLTA